MIVRCYRLTESRRFEVQLESINTHADEALIKVNMASICKADLRYYLGQRRKELLDAKYPLALLHEAVGVVLKDPTGTYHTGERVVLVPNIIKDTECQCDTCMDNRYGQNYCSKARFCASTIDGFSKEIISHPVRYLVPIPENVDDELAVFTEIVSVAFAATRRFDCSKYNTVGIWGDGPIGYVMALVIKFIGGDRLFVVGMVSEYLDQFKFVDHTYLFDDVIGIGSEKFNVAFECVGGNGIAEALQQIFTFCPARTRVILLGVSDELVPIPTRILLEKGLIVTGSSRSERSDHEKALRLLSTPHFQEHIRRLIKGRIAIRKADDLALAFEEESRGKGWGRLLLDLSGC